MVLKSFRILLPAALLFSLLMTTGCPQKRQVPESESSDPTIEYEQPPPGVDTDWPEIPGEMMAKADSEISKMKSALATVINLQQAAKKQNDVIRVNCVNDRLIQIKKLINIAEGARNDLTEAVANKDKRDQQHQLSKVAISGENVTGLTGEARQCVGDDLIFVDNNNQIEVQKPNITDDPTQDPSPETADTGKSIERPAFASPFGS